MNSRTFVQAKTCPSLMDLAYSLESRKVIARACASEGMKAICDSPQTAVAAALRALSYDTHCAVALAIFAGVSFWHKHAWTQAENLARDALRFCESPWDDVAGAAARETLACSLFQQCLETGCYDLNKAGEAERILSALLRVYPNHANLNRVMALVLNYQPHRIGEAREYATRAVALCPGNPQYESVLGFIDLAMGEMGAGWKRINAALYRKTERSWDGSSLAGKTLLVRYDGAGFGDYIQYGRYAEAVEATGGHVVVECPDRAMPLVLHIKGVASATRLGGDLPAHDFETPLATLPELCGNRSLSDIWWTGPYLTTDPARVRAQGERIARFAGDRLRVGLSWACDQRRTNFRSIPLAAMARVGSVAGVALFGLQRGPKAAEIDGADFEVINLEDPDGTLMDTAAAMMNLDLIISVDTMTCHMAGALGRPVWTLLPFMHDVRWLLDRSDTPLYPTMRLFREGMEGGWHPVVTAVCDELERLASQIQYHTNV